MPLHHTEEIYRDAEKVLDCALYRHITCIQIFEGTGIKNYGSITDIERKLILMLKGGIYSDFDGIQLTLPTSVVQSPHTFKVPFHNNDPYFSLPSKELWLAVLWEIVARYEKSMDQGLLCSKKRKMNDQKYTCFLTGPGLMCEYSDAGRQLDNLIEQGGWFKRLESAKSLSYADYLRNFVLTGRAYDEHGGFSKTEFSGANKRDFVEDFCANPLKKYGAMYITDADGFARAVFYAQTWVGKKGKKRKGFVTPDTLDYL